MINLSSAILSALEEGRLTVVELKNVPVGGINITAGPQNNLVAVEAFQLGSAIGQSLISVGLFGSGPNGANIDIPVGYATVITLPTITRVSASAVAIGAIFIRLYFIKPSTSK